MVDNSLVGTEDTVTYNIPLHTCAHSTHTTQKTCAHTTNTHMYIHSRYTCIHSFTSAHTHVDNTHFNLLLWSSSYVRDCPCCFLWQTALYILPHTLRYFHTFCILAFWWVRSGSKYCNAPHSITICVCWSLPVTMLPRVRRAGDYKRCTNIIELSSDLNILPAESAHGLTVETQA